MSKNGFVTSLIGSRSFYMGFIIVRPPRRRTLVWISSLVVVLRSFQISRDSLSLIFFLALSPHLGAFMIIPESPDSFAHVMFGKLPESAGDALWSI